MTKRILVAITIIIALFVTSCNQTSTNGAGDSVPATVELNNELDSLSYAWGVNVGNYLKGQGYSSLNYQAVSSALKNSIESGETLLDAATANKMLQDYAQKKRQSQQAEDDKMKAVYKKEGEEFLKKNAERKEIKVTDSGLQYEIIKEGTGAVPRVGQKVNAHYHGTLIDGTVFDSSVDRGQPFSFEVGKRQVIKGWDEAFSMMPVGSKWKIYLPSEIAYGENPRPGGAIKPNMVLIFEVELLSIEE